MPDKEARTKSVNVSSHDILLVISCGIVLALVMSINRTSSVNRSLAELLGISQSFESLITAILYAALAIISYLQLRFLSFRNSIIYSTGMSICFITLLIAIYLVGPSTLTGSRLMVVESMLMQLAHVWLMLLFILLLLRLPSTKLVAASLIIATLLNQLLLYPFRLASSAIAKLTLAVVLAVVVMAVLANIDKQSLNDISIKVPMRQLEITNPISALWPPSTLYAIILLISLTYFFASTIVGVPALGTSRMTVVFAVLILLSVLLIKGTAQEDSLFTLVVLFIMAGLIITPISMETGLGQTSGSMVGTFVAHTLFWLGRTCFNVLLWLLIYSIGSRNMTVSVPVLGIIGCFNLLGRFLGSWLGNQANSLAGSGMVNPQTIDLVLALIFFTLVWLGLRNFSFSQAIRGIEHVEMPLDNLPVSVDTADAVAQQANRVVDKAAKNTNTIAEIAIKAGLTPRETEVFELLAKGRNASYIMDALHITRNTAKAHTAHIYAKIGVHSHQELLSLVEGTQEDDHAR